MKKSLLLVLALCAAACTATEPEPYMKLEQQKFDVSADGGSVSLVLSANVKYSVINDMDWATLEESTREGATTVYTLEVSANEATEPRLGTVRFIGKNTTPLKVTVNQRRFVPVGFDVTQIDLPFDATGTTVGILADKPWTVESDNADFVLSSTSGSSDTELSLSFPENTSTQPRTVHITVTLGEKSYVCTITQGGAPSADNPVDLSAEGTSNCYIVSSRGYYKFKADVRGNGVAVASTPDITTGISPSSAAILWSTVSTATPPSSPDAIISSVTLKDGYIEFGAGMGGSSTLTAGNTIIAAYDGSGNILWTWHIWVRPAVNAIEFGETWWMDYNLGALSDSLNDSESDFLSVGFYYQWGRKDPLGSITGEIYAGSHSEIAVAGSQFPATSEISDESTVAYSIAHPQSHFMTPTKNENLVDWLYLPNGAREDEKDDLWGGSGAAKTSKTMYDPCPPGYCVPSAAQVSALKEAGFKNRSSEIFYVGSGAFKFIYTGGMAGRKNMTYLYFDATHYYTSDISGNNAITFKFTTAISYKGTIQRAFAFPVRCVKE